MPFHVRLRGRKAGQAVQQRDFIQKPFTTRTLAQTVRQVLDGGPPAQGERAAAEEGAGGSVQDCHTS